MQPLVIEELSQRLSLTKDDLHALVYNVHDKVEGLLTRQQFENIYGRDTAGRETLSGESVRVLAEGDSWINILWPWSALLGHERTFFDVIQRNHAYQTSDLAFPGDLFEDMLNRKEYKGLLKSASYAYFVFSGGGNDLLGGGALQNVLKNKKDTDPQASPESWFINKELDKATDKIRNGYELLAKETAVWGDGHTTLLIHGYDYPIPRAGEPWLGKPLHRKGYDLCADAVQIAQIFIYLVDRFYDVLEGVAAHHPQATLIDLRGIVGSRWNDELHPKTAASRDIARMYVAAMAPTS